jgi:cytochrome c oxidase cbb3-type subunit III
MKRMQMLATILGISAALANAAEAQRTAPPPVRSPEHVEVGGTPPPAGGLQNPYKDNKQAAEEGGKLFSSFNCDGCHAGGAAGAVGPSLADGRWRYGGSEGEIYHSIFYGRPRGMPAWGGTLPSEAIWRLVTYLKSIEPAKDTVGTTSW